MIESYTVQGKKIYHFDLYRMTRSRELDFIGASDCWGEGIRFVEWAEKGEGYLPRPDLVMAIEVENEIRQVKFMAYSLVGKEIIQRLKLHE